MSLKEKNHMDDILRELIRRKYAKAITAQAGCCGDGPCCGGTSGATQMITGNLYDADHLDGLPAEALAASLGCGNPTALAGLHPGETVLDLGSGAGLDVLLSARRVGPYGRAYGLDMTDEMLAAANANKAKAGIANAEFLKGHIETIPLPDNAVDVVISNCVINLSPDKDAVFREIFRVIRPGGRVAVSDIVVTRPLPDKLRQNVLAWAGCIAGALTDAEYRTKLAAAGFINCEIEVTRVYDLTSPAAGRLVDGLTPAETADLDGSLVSAFIRAKKPAVLLVPGVDFTLRPARPADLPAMSALLAGGGLPAAGLADNLAAFTVADRAGIVGIAGLQMSGDAALLRSLVVAPACRKAGVAAALVDHILAQAKAAGVKTVHLLTDTAAGYFVRRGFTPADRSAIPPALLAASGLGDACPASAASLQLDL